MIVLVLLFGVAASSSNPISKGGREIFVKNKVEPIGKNVTVFRSENILAEVNFHGDRAVHCRLSSISLPKDEIRLIELFDSLTPVANEKMMKWVITCGKLETHITQDTPFDNAVHLMRKIFPGTLWCGPGNVADSYNSLGRNTETDRCCRDHDFCPVCIPCHTDKYGWNKTFEFSVVSCECDIRFHECLERASLSDYSATLLQEAYFDVYNAPCVGFSSGKPTPYRIKDVLRNHSLV